MAIIHLSVFLLVTLRFIINLTPVNWWITSNQLPHPSSSVSVLKRIPFLKIPIGGIHIYSHYSWIVEISISLLPPLLYQNKRGGRGLHEMVSDWRRRISHQALVSYENKRLMIFSLFDVFSTGKGKCDRRDATMQVGLLKSWPAGV